MRLVRPEGDIQVQRAVRSGSGLKDLTVHGFASALGALYLAAGIDLPLTAGEIGAVR